jgi:hypothetical protein
MFYLVRLLRTASTYLLLSVIIVGVAVLPAVTAVAQPSPDRTPYSGRLTDVNGSPVANASVTLRKQLVGRRGTAAFWGSVTYTDREGRFSFSDTEAGTYSLAVEASGFAPVANRSIMIGDGIASDVASVIRLERLANIKVQVLSFEGQPLKLHSFAVQLRKALELRSSRGQVSTFSTSLMVARTNNEGIAVFSKLVPGNYSITGVARNVGFGELSNVVITAEDTTPVLNLQLQQGGTLRIRNLSETDDRPLGGGRVFFKRLQYDERPGNFVQGNDESVLYCDGAALVQDVSGLFEVSGMAPGRYSVGLQSQNERAIRNSPSQTIEISAGKTSELVFKSATAAASFLKLLIKDKNGAAASDVQVALTFVQRPNATNGQISNMNVVRGQVGVFGLLRQVRYAITDASGLVTIYPLQEGKWQVSASRRASMTNMDAVVIGQGVMPAVVNVEMRGRSGRPQVIDLPATGGEATLSLLD